MVEKGYSVPDVSKRLGISNKFLYYSVSQAKVPASQSAEQAEICQLKAEVKRVTEERNIVKEAAVSTLQASQRKVQVHKTTILCLSRQYHVLHVHRSCDYRDFLKAHNLIPYMSRRGHCLDNAIAESFFHSLKTQGVKLKVCPHRSAVRADWFDYIEVFCNRTRLHSHLGHVSPDEYENTYSQAS